MARFIDSADLFGVDIGVSTCADFTCAICGGKHNEGNIETGRFGGYGILITNFAGVEICGNCFEAVEKEIIRRMCDILPWYKKIIGMQKNRIKKMEDLYESFNG